MSLGSTLHRLRKERQYTLEDLGTRSGLHLSTISRLEDDQNPRVGAATLSKLAKALGVDVRLLYESAGWYISPAEIEAKRRVPLSDEERRLIRIIRSAPTADVRKRLLRSLIQVARMARDLDNDRNPQQTSERQPGNARVRHSE